MRVALVHDWLTGMRGGEKVLAEICALFPRSDLFTLLHIPGRVDPVIEDRRIHTSFVQGLPRARKQYRRYLPLFPLAIGDFDFSQFDAVVSSSHCVAKGIRVPEGVPHVCYCHTPMRYVWDQFDAYFGPGQAGLATRTAMRILRRPLQWWDRAGAASVTHFIANSRTVANRIRLYYERDATVIHPPVDCSRFTPAGPDQREDFYLVVSALVPYKRIDLAVEACKRLDRPLVVVGTGPERDRLDRLAGPKTRFLGWQSDEEVAVLFRTARAFLFPGVEDFGITPVEATASGCPVIAYGEGGATETVLPRRTGLFFRHPSPAALCESIQEFEEIEGTFDPRILHAHAGRYDRPRFREEMRHFLAETLPGPLPQPGDDPVSAEAAAAHA